MKIKRKEEQIIKKFDNGFSSRTFFSFYYEFWFGVYVEKEIVMFEEVSGEKEYIKPVNEIFVRAI